MTVESIRLRFLLIGPIRLVLGVVFLGAARAAGELPTDATVAPAWHHRLYVEPRQHLVFRK